ncbi:sulfotransferase family 2 domain-containing protein [Pararhizobium sp. IMCC21322]|uniref:sulfotransferase family 2 domain-containing protein n=1 Tax=Pararhizobium sp. IMCC21322 TaxID=3067903 RepID=UPI002740BF6E|nr:sulfotransferase family 2 domain-containing protein [Pararhizobium sp. IMCC21322]
MLKLPLKLIDSLKVRSAHRGAIKRLDGRVANKFALRKFVLNTEFGLCYNRIQKNANSTTVILMDSISGGNRDAKISGGNRDAKRAKIAVPSIGDLGRADISRLHEFRYFVVVRNPYSRVLSAFLDKFSREKYKRRHREFSLDSAGFHEFVRWLDKGGLSKNSHWDLQQKQMCFEVNGYDTVISFEDYNAEIRDFLVRSGVPADRISLDDSTAKGMHHKTSASDRLHQFYNADTQSIVKRCFMSDFLNLGYDPDRLD